MTYPGKFLGRIMKKGIIVIIFVIISSVSAWPDTVILQWDPNIETDLSGYCLYRAERIGDHSTAWKKVATIPKDNTTYKDELDEKNYAWILTAFDTAGNESFPSNMVERYDWTPPIRVKDLRMIQEELKH